MQSIYQLYNEKKPDGRGQASIVHAEVNQMNINTLTENRLNRKIYLFQKAVEAYAKTRSLQNAQVVAEAKRNLVAFVGGGCE